MKIRPLALRPNSVKGFTLIELVMVIVIIGVLAAVALPRFFDMGSQARSAAVNCIYGAVNSASAISHSAALVNGLGNTAPGASVYITMEGQQVLVGYGYPTAAGIVNAVNTGSNAATTTATAATWAVSGGSGTCSVVYTAPTAVGTAPTITATTSGC